MVFRAMLPFSGRATQERTFQKAKDKGRLDLNIDDKLEKEILNLWHEVGLSRYLAYKDHSPEGRTEGSCHACRWQISSKRFLLGSGL